MYASASKHCKCLQWTPLYGEDILQITLYGEDILQITLYGEDILQITLYGEDILQITQYGEDILQITLYGEDILQITLYAQKIPFEMNQHLLIVMVTNMRVPQTSKTVITVTTPSL